MSNGPAPAQDHRSLWRVLHVCAPCSTQGGVSSTGLPMQRQEAGLDPELALACQTLVALSAQRELLYLHRKEEERKLTT